MHIDSDGMTQCPYCEGWFKDDDAEWGVDSDSICIGGTLLDDYWTRCPKCGKKISY